MKIAYVRGAFLNPFELQLYEPLAQRHDFTAIGATWQFYPYPIDLPRGRIEKAHLWGPPWFNRALSWTVGSSYGLCGLNRLVGKTDILHPAESFFTMTYQCL